MPSDDGVTIQRRTYVTKDSGQRESYDSGAVRDVRSGKGRYDLISTLAMRRVAGVYERGAAKYADRNWEQGIPIMRAIDSAKRHLDQYIEGQADEDHLAQAAWNVIAALHFDEGIKRGLYDASLDDRPKYLPFMELQGRGDGHPASRGNVGDTATFGTSPSPVPDDDHLGAAVRRMIEDGDIPMPEVSYSSTEQWQREEVMHDWSHSEDQGLWHVHTQGATFTEGPAYHSTPASPDSKRHTHERP